MNLKRITSPILTARLEKARSVVERINRATDVDGCKPIIFDTIVNGEIRNEIRKVRAMIDIFGTFEPWNRELGLNQPIRWVNPLNSLKASCDQRIDAQFHIDNDDGAHATTVMLKSSGGRFAFRKNAYLHLSGASIWGSRQYNFPITEDEILDQRLPEALRIGKKTLV